MADSVLTPKDSQLIQRVLDAVESRSTAEEKGDTALYLGRVTRYAIGYYRQAHHLMPLGTDTWPQEDKFVGLVLLAALAKRTA